MDDIREVLKNTTKGTVDPVALKDFYDSSGMALMRAIESPDRAPRPKDTVYASELRDVEVCPRKVWYKIHHPEDFEDLTPQTRVKFLYGDMTEALALFLAAQAGHEVTDIQGECELNFADLTIRGRMDCKIDGNVVDVKSCSAYAFKKMTDPNYDWSSDPFAYHRQLQFYDGAQKERLGESRAPYLLLLEKQSGDMALVAVPSYHSHPASTVFELSSVYVKARDIWQLSRAPDIGENALKICDETFVGDEPATNGNRKLKTYCSYCGVKHRCFADAGIVIQGYAYANGPVWLTKINKEPKAEIPRIKNPYAF
jgi:hypothetical protein